MPPINHKIITLIPARSLSKRIINKNIKPLNHIPLIIYSIKSALSISHKSSVILSSDSKYYLDLVKDYNINCLLRPKSLSTDISTDYDVINHCLSMYPAEYIVYLRPTTPFRQSDILHKALRLILDHPEATGLRSIEEMTESAYKSFIFDG